MDEKLEHINNHDDSLRRMPTLEPRGTPVGGVVLLLPATLPEADVGLIVLLQDRAHAMSGSNAMCAATALLATGAVAMTEPETRVIFDTAAGLVTATAQCRQGQVENVSIDMPVSFVSRQDVTIDLPHRRGLTFDICFGGVFYGIVDADQIGLEIAPENARRLAETGLVLRDSINALYDVVHPTRPRLRSVSYVMFVSNKDDHVLTCTTLPPGRVDRSACGTGSAALMALRVTRGLNQEGDDVVTRSIIGSEFANRINSVDFDSGNPVVQSSLTGRCWIYGTSNIGLDPTDPFPRGFSLPGA